MRGEKPKWILHSLGNLLRPLEQTPASPERVVPTEWQVRAVLGDCISRAKVIPAQAPQCGQFALISDFLDLANLSIQKRSSIGHELDQGPTRRVERREPYVGAVYQKFCLQTPTTQITIGDLWAQGHN